MAPMEQGTAADNSVAVSYLDYEAFFIAEFDSVYRSIKWIVYDDDLAVELTQEAFYRALVRWRKIADYERPGAWVRLVGIRLANKRKFEKLVSLEAAAEASSEDNEAKVAVVNDVRSAIKTLPVLQRSVVLLFYFYDYPTNEIADSLRKSDAAVRNALSRARERLRVFLLARGYSD